MIDQAIAADEIGSSSHSAYRTEDRELCLIEAHAFMADARVPVPCFIENISLKGAQVRISDRLELPPEVSLLIPVSQDAAEMRNCELIWAIEGVAGLRFSN